MTCYRDHYHIDDMTDLQPNSVVEFYLPFDIYDTTQGCLEDFRTCLISSMRLFSHCLVLSLKIRDNVQKEFRCVQ